MIALVEPRMCDVLALIIGSTPAQNWLTRHARGIAYTGINIDTLKQLPVPLPPLAEQAEIVATVSEKLSQIESAEVAIEHSLRRAARLRQSILKQAFEGKLVPQDPTDEPASSLLERIKTANQSTMNENQPVRAKRRK